MHDKKEFVQFVNLFKYLKTRLEKKCLKMTRRLRQSTQTFSKIFKKVYEYFWIFQRYLEEQGHWAVEIKVTVQCSKKYIF